MMKENEEALLEMPFEVMLGYITNMPVKFVIEEVPLGSEASTLVACKKFDKQMVAMKVPTILLERLYREFDESNQ